MKTMRIISQDAETQLIRDFLAYLSKKMPGVTIERTTYATKPKFKGDIIVAERLQSPEEFNTQVKSLSNNYVFALDEFYGGYQLNDFVQGNSSGLTGVVCRHSKEKPELFVAMNNRSLHAAELLLFWYIQDIVPTNYFTETPAKTNVWGQARALLRH